MIKLHRRLHAEMPEAAIILQVHDELIVEAPASTSAAVASIVRESMESAVTLSVPLTVDIGMGENWFEAHRL